MKNRLHAPLGRSLQSLLVSLALVLPASAASPRNGTWIASWASSQLQPYGNEVLPADTFDDTTLREVVHLSAGGRRLRVHLANTFGGSPLVLRSVRIARPAAGHAPGAIDPSTTRALTFSGHADVSIPMGAEYLSDAIDFPVDAQADLVIDMEIAKAPGAVTLHTGARATSFLARGSHNGEAAFDSPQTFTRWYFLAGVEVENTGKAPGTIVALGDSITDGHGSTTDGNDRWPDVLARRLAVDGHTHDFAVANEGIGGNHLLYDGLGPNALARFDRDVLSQPGVRYLIVLEGINDLGGLDRIEDHSQAEHDAWLAQIKDAMTQVVTRAHEHGILVYGGTLTPWLGSDYYHPGPRSEADRVALNQWIRTSGIFDQVIDFEAAVRDPAHPDHLLPAADSGDHLHPGPDGYRRMGEAIPLSLFRK